VVPGSIALDAGVGRIPVCRPLGDRGVADRQRAAEEWEMSYLATTETVTWISDTPGILTIVPDT
jgi:hypothetical protein